MPHYLVEIEPSEGRSEKPSQILSDAEKIVVSHMNNDSLKFKVFGENKIVLIAEGEEPQNILDGLNEQIGGAVKMTTTPVRPYETFAQQILGVEKSLTQVKTGMFPKPATILLIKVTLDFPGVSMEDYIKLWKKEAAHGLHARSMGKGDFRPFKAIATRAIYIFFNLPFAEAADNSLHVAPLALHAKTANGFQFPVVRELRPISGGKEPSLSLNL